MAGSSHLNPFFFDLMAGSSHLIFLDFMASSNHLNPFWGFDGWFQPSDFFWI
jgi:hypothetical protein